MKKYCLFEIEEKMLDRVIKKTNRQGVGGVKNPPLPHPSIPPLESH